MKCVIQRVKHASVKVDNAIVGAIESGYLIYVGFHKDDPYNIISKAVEKIMKLRLFEDDDGKMNIAINPKKHQIMCISQFTLYGETKGTNRPSFSQSMPFEQAHIYYQHMLEECNKHIKTVPGHFGANMHITSENDGPVTLILEF